MPMMLARIIRGRGLWVPYSPQSPRQSTPNPLFRLFRLIRLFSFKSLRSGLFLLDELLQVATVHRSIESWWGSTQQIVLGQSEPLFLLTFLGWDKWFRAYLLRAQVEAQGSPDLSARTHSLKPTEPQRPADSIADLLSNPDPHIRRRGRSRPGPSLRPPSNPSCPFQPPPKPFNLLNSWLGTPRCGCRGSAFKRLR